MLEIHAQWDDEARVWWALSTDVPGLCVQADTFDELVEQLQAIIPELMELNLGVVGKRFEFRVTCERTAIAEAA